MRLLLLALVTTVGYAHADDWRTPKDSAMYAVQAQSTPEATGVPQIINGVPTTEYLAVADLHIQDSTGAYRCTGTLVSPSVILTAAHCIANTEGPFSVRASFFANGSTVSIDYYAVEYSIHPAYSFPFADLAMLLLEAPVAGITPVSLARWTPRPRTIGLIVGYGDDERGNTGVKKMGRVRLARCPKRVPPALHLKRGALSGSLCWRAPLVWQQDTCHGDSGGPLLVNGTLAGVTSGGDPDCLGRLSYDTNVVPFLSWIVRLLR
jgi:transmembrane serine protease 9